MKNNKRIIICILTFWMASTGVLFCENNSRIKLFTFSGVSFPVYPTWFSNDRKPAVNFGFGVELKLSPRIAIRENLNIYSYYPKEDYYSSIWIGDFEMILPGKGIYRGNQFFSSYDLWFDLKYILLKKDQLSVYISAGGGVCYIRYISGFSYSVSGSEFYRSLALHPLVLGGFGMDYKISKNVIFFLM